jgi:hypothetical protein
MIVVRIEILLECVFVAGQYRPHERMRNPALNRLNRGELYLPRCNMTPFGVKFGKWV